MPVRSNESLVLEWTGDVHLYVTLCQAFNIIAMLVIVLILVCMAVYGKRNDAWHNTKPGRLFIAGCTALFLALPPFPLAIAIPYIGHKNDVVQCELLLDAFAVMSAMFLFAAYQYLWYRQRTIYKIPCMRPIFGKFVNTLSWIVFGAINAQFIGFSVGYAVPKSYKEINNTCIFDPYVSQDKLASGWQKVRKYIVGGCTITSQVILLLLFIYPMVKTRNSQDVYQRANNSGDGDMIVSVMRRATVCTAISVLSDVLAFALRGLLPWGSAVLYSTTVHNMNFFVNAICVMCTFGPIKILSEFCWTSKKETSSNPVNVTCFVEENV